MRRLLLMIMFCGAVTSKHYAQNIKEKFVRYGVNEGLSQSSVYSIFQDSKGYLWAGTADGLNRFDGYQFNVFRSEGIGKQGLSDDYFYGDIIEDKNENLWFGTQKGINFFNYKKGSFKAIYPGNDTAKFTSYTELMGFDKKGNLFFWNNVNSLYSFSPETNKYYEIVLEDRFKIERKHLYHLSEYYSDGKIFFKCETGIGCYDTESRKFSMFLENFFIKNKLHNYSYSYIDKEKNVWISTESCVVKWNTKDDKTELIYYNNSKQKNIFFQCITEDNFGRLWVGSINEGLFYIDKKTLEMYNFKHDEKNEKSIPFNVIRSMCIDKSQNLWIGTDGGGLGKLDLKPQVFKHYNFNPRNGWNFSSNFTKCFYEDKKGKIYIGTYEKGVMTLDRKQNKTENIIWNSSWDNCTKIIEDKNRNIIFGTSDGMKYYYPKNHQISDIPSSIKLKYQRGIAFINDAFFLHDGTLLIPTTQGLFTGVIKNKKVISIKFESKIPSSFITGFENKAGKIFMSFMNATFSTLSTIKRNKAGEFIPDEILLKGETIRSFYEDTLSNTLYMGSENGLIVYNEISKTYIVKNIKDGLVNNYIYGIVADHQNRLWLSTNKGISCYDITKNTFKNYDTDDGLQSNEFNTGAFGKLKSGEIIFGGINGFNIFNPDKILENKFLANPVLTAFMVNDNTYRSGNISLYKTITLPYDSSTVSFEFSGLEFSNPDKNKYIYKLEGFDQAWVISGQKRFARYANLPTGEYFFKLKASNNNGLFSEEKTLMKIIISPPYWKKWWFIILVSSVIIFFLIYAIYYLSTTAIRKRLHELEKQHAVQNERERISKDMHDDIGSGLSKIAILSEILKRNINNEKDTQIQIEKISQSSRQLVDNLSEIIWSMNPKYDSLKSLLSYLRSYITDFFEDTGTLIFIDFPEPENDTEISADFRRNIYLVIKEALNNVLKYALASEVKITITIENKMLIVSIHDNGKGFDTGNTREFGNGLSNMKKRIEILDGKYWITSTIGKGTEMKFEINIS